MASEDNKTMQEDQPDQHQANGGNNSSDNKQDDNKAKEDKAKEDKAKENDPKEKRKKKIAFIIFGVVLLLGLIGGLLYWLHSRNLEDTDDAQIDGNLAPVGSRIAGTVTAVHVDNNAIVKAGDLLVEMDPRDNQASVEQAEAQLEQAQTQVASQQPNIPIQRVQNITQIQTSSESVAGAQAAVAGAAPGSR